MSDFLSREADILGNEFSTSLHRPTGSDDIDFDRAASAFPDIDIDGDFSQPPTIVAARTSSGFSFDDFGTPPSSQVKVTGDDDFDTFESDFPEIDAGQVSRHSSLELGCSPGNCSLPSLDLLPLHYDFSYDDNFY